MTKLGMNKSHTNHLTLRAPWFLVLHTGQTLGRWGQSDCHSWLLTWLSAKGPYDRRPGDGQHGILANTVFAKKVESRYQDRKEGN
jgi:hypothetical protein